VFVALVIGAAGWLALVGLVVLIGAGNALATVFDSDMPFPWLPGAACLTVYGLAAGRGPLERWLSSPVALFAGRISFAFYMIHGILLGIPEQIIRCLRPARGNGCCHVASAQELRSGASGELDVSLGRDFRRARRCSSGHGAPKKARLQWPAFSAFQPTENFREPRESSRQRLLGAVERIRRNALEREYRVSCAQAVQSMEITTLINGAGRGTRETAMLRYLVAAAAAAFLAMPAWARVGPFPASFHTQMVQTNGTSLYVRVGGKGPAVVLLHGFGDTGDMWAPMAEVLAKDHTVIVPDLRGMGLSAHPDTGYTKKNQAADIAGLMDALQVQKADLVTHDIGDMVGYALAAQYPARITRWVVIDAPLPGIGDWDNIIRSPLLWHFNFRGPDMERLVHGRERIYLDRFWNELSADPRRIDEQTRQHYASLYARPHAMHDAFEQFAAFNQDALDNKALLAQNGKITMPVLAIGAEKSFGTAQADDLRFVASNVIGGIVPNSGHWIMEENPQVTIKLTTEFLGR
jgi:pimeloyl-ACP methyl ester carboxylesterase